MIFNLVYLGCLYVFVSMYMYVCMCVYIHVVMCMQVSVINMIKECMDVMCLSMYRYMYV